MSLPIFDRVRRKRFAELLDEAAGHRRRHRRTDHDAELAGLVRLGDRVAAVPSSLEPDPDFQAGLRAALMATIAQEGIGATAEARAAKLARRAAVDARTQVIRPVPAGHARTRLAVLAGLTAGALALSGVSAASTKAIPGEPLYQVKRSTERAQLALAVTDLARGRLHLAFAHSRLYEAGRVPPERSGPVLADLDREALLGSELLLGWAAEHREGAALDIVDDFLTDARRELDRLRPAYPTAESQRVLDRISAQLRTARTAWPG